MSHSVIHSKIKQGLALLICMLVWACTPDTTDLDHLQQAKQFHEQNQWRAAMIELKNALQKNPQNLEARQMLGMLYLDIGEGAPAEKELRRVAESAGSPGSIAAPIARAMLLQRQHEKLLAEFAPPDLNGQAAAPELLGVRAEALAALGKFELAQAAITRAINQDSVPLPVMLSAARVALARGVMTEAQEWVRRAVEQAPADPNVWLLNGDLAFLASRHADAVQGYQRVLDLDQRQLLTQRNVRARAGIVFALLAQEQPDAALPHIEVLLAANPKHFLSNYLRGLAAFKKTDFKTALDYLQRSNESAPPNNPVAALLGAVHYGLGNYQQADLYLGRYADMVPDDIAARKLLGATRLKLHQPEQALEALGTAAEKSSDTQLLAMMGEAAAMSGEFRTGRDYFRRALKTAKNPGMLQTQLAQTYLEEGDYDHAIAELQRAAQDTHTEKRAKILTVMAYLRKKDTAAALKAAQSLVAEKPADPEMPNLLGGVHLVQKDFKAARLQFQQALALEAKFIPALMNLATLEWREKNLVAARAAFLRVLEVAPNHLLAMLSLAQIEQEDNNSAAAVAWLEKARAADPAAVEPRLLLAQYHLRGGALDKAEAFAEEAFALRPSQAAVLSMRANVQLARRQYPQAATTLEALLKTQPDDAHGHFRLGQTRIHLRQHAQARNSLRRAMTLAPDAVAIVAALVVLEVQQANTGAALELVDKYLQKHPAEADAYMLRGDVLMAQEHYAAADQAYLQAEKIQQTQVLTLKRARALNQAGAVPRAQEVLQRWLEAHPQDDVVRLSLADAYRTSGRAAEAVDIYNKILAAKPDQVAVLNNLALTYLSSNDPRALATAEKAYNLAPKHPFIADTYGWVLLQSGDAKKSKPILEQAYEKMREQPDIQTHLALSLEQNGEPERARELLAQVLRNKQRFEARPLAEAASKRLQAR